jgi:hypothetical protein
MPLTRRATLSLACLALIPLPLRAEDCPPLLPGLSLCGTDGWRLTSVDGPTASLIHVSGITGSVTLLTGRTDEEMMWDGWQAAHAPISARAQVLEVALTESIGLSASTTAYLPRHLLPPAVIVLTSAQGNGLSLSVSTQAPGETYDDPHRQAHAALLSALRLDPLE